MKTILPKIFGYEITGHNMNCGTK